MEVKMRTIGKNLLDIMGLKKYKKDGINCVDSTYNLEFNFHIDTVGEHGNRIIFNEFLKTIGAKLKTVGEDKGKFIVDIKSFTDENLDRIQDVFNALLDKLKIW